MGKVENSSLSHATEVNGDNRINTVCPDCESSHLVNKFENEAMEYGAGDSATIINVAIPVTHCLNCGFSFTGSDAANLRHDAICRHLNLLTPLEIRQLRVSLGLTQEGFSKLSGIGVASLGRWEASQLLQSKSHDKLMRLMGNAQNIKQLKQEARTESQKNIEGNNFFRPRALNPDKLASILHAGQKFLLRPSRPVLCT